MISKIKNRLKSEFNTHTNNFFMRNGILNLGKPAVSGAFQFMTHYESGKVLLDLDYPPSRDYRPRWGNTHGLHSGLSQMFAKRREEYFDLLIRVGSLEPFFSKISRTFDGPHQSAPGWLGGAINPLDSALLYAFIAEHKPKTYLEIGSGVTTLFALQAKKDHSPHTQIISIDPQPRASIDAACDKVIRQAMETVDLSIFFALQPGDIVFMDGSHRSFMNSDVTVFMLDVLPYLKPGVIVHFHDIVLPYDYDQMFVDWHWNEQYILAAYLLGAGEKVKILMPSRFISDSPELKSAFKPILDGWNGDPTPWLIGGSFWFTHQ